MAKWSILEWLLLQFAVLAALGCLGFGIAFQMSKARIKRLQKEFKKLAKDMGEAIASAASEQGVHFDSLLMQTQAHLQSQGLSVPWQQVDPLQHPELLPLFLRCAVLDTELSSFDDMEDDDYWPRLTAAYDKVLFDFGRDAQVSSVDSRAMQRRVNEAEELTGILRGRIATLETDLLRAKDALMHQPAENSYQGDPNRSEEEVIADYERILEDRASGPSDVNTAEQHVNMLSNIIEDQKARIKSIQADLKQLRKPDSENELGERGLEAKKKEKNMELLEEQNEALKAELLKVEGIVDAKEQELTQLLDQVGAVASSESPGAEEEIQMRRALVEAWLNTEKSLAEFEHQVLSRS